VRGTLTCLLVAAGLGLLATPATARPGARLDVGPILAALDSGEQVIRAPGAVARFDETRVRTELGPTVRMVVLPYVDHELYRTDDSEGSSEYFEVVQEPILTWSLDREIPVVVVTGLDVNLLNGGSARGHRLPADLDELRTTTSTRVVTERVVVLARLGRGVEPAAAETAEVAHPAPVPAPSARAAEVVDALRENRIYNARGRSEPIADWVVETARTESGLNLRIAAFPWLAPGQPVVDYTTAISAAYPDDVVMVLHGDWLDIAAPDQRKALAARAYAYGDADLTLLTSGTGATMLLRHTVQRLDLLLSETSWGYPQPPPQPRAVPFDVQRTVSTLTPWVLVGSAIVLGSAAVLRHRNRLAAEADTEARVLRSETASAMAAIGDLGTRVLTADEKGSGADPAAAERLATARLLYDQAHTSAAMVEVRKIAEEGLALLVTTAPAGPDREGRKRKAARRRRSR
jgi:hypothetical protein